MPKQVKVNKQINPLMPIDQILIRDKKGRYVVKGLEAREYNCEYVLFIEGKEVSRQKVNTPSYYESDVIKEHLRTKTGFFGKI